MKLLLDMDAYELTDGLFADGGRLPLVPHFLPRIRRSEVSSSTEKASRSVREQHKNTLLTF